MDPLVATLVLIVLALLGARFSFSTQRVPAGPRLLFRTGIHFLVLGYLLGPGGLGLLSGDAVAELQPLLALGLGWVGLLFGMQLDRETLRQFPLGFHLLTVAQAALAFGLFFGLGMAGLELAGRRSETATLILMGAAATASMTTPAGVAMVSANFLARGKVRQLLFFVSSVDALVGILAIQVAYSLYHPGPPLAGFQAPPAAAWFVLALGLGIVCGILFVWLVRPRPGREELVLYLLGIASLASGAALQLQLSPIFVCVVTGAVMANLAPDSQRVFQALQKWEKPIYVVLLLLAGALLTLPSWWALPLAAAYALLRGLAKWSANAGVVSLLPLPFRVPRNLGLGLIPQGGISLALAISIVLTFSGLTLPDGTRGVELLFAVIVLGVVISELVGPFLTVRLLTSAGEISTRAVEALEEGDEERAEAEALDRAPAEPPPGSGL